jgi:hypothetical protein
MNLHSQFAPHLKLHLSPLFDVFFLELSKI